MALNTQMNAHVTSNLCKATDKTHHAVVSQRPLAIQERNDHVCSLAASWAPQFCTSSALYESTRMSPEAPFPLLSWSVYPGRSVICQQTWGQDPNVRLSQVTGPIDGHWLPLVESNTSPLPRKDLVRGLPLVV